jgi:hypothetical protein
MKSPGRRSFLTSLQLWIGLAQGAAALGLAQTTPAGETNYFGPAALAPIHAATNSPDQEDAEDARRLLQRMPAVARFYRANGEPSYADGPGPGDRVVRICQIGNYINTGCWLVTFSERNGAVERTRTSGYLDTRRTEPYALGTNHVRKATLDPDEFQAYGRILQNLRYAQRRPGGGLNGIDAPTAVLEIRDAQTHFISAVEGLTAAETDWWELQRLAQGPRDPGQNSAFLPDGQGGFTFKTAFLRGRLHAGGRSLGLTEVYDLRTGARVDGGNGLLSHDRVFANGRRFGNSAGDWPSTATRLYNGSAEIRWPAGEDRPFAMRAVYHLNFGQVTLFTFVEPQVPLRGFEVFLASHFEAAFTNARVGVLTGPSRTVVEATADQGAWQMYVRDDDARALVEDGRWRIDPHPVTWTFPATAGKGWLSAWGYRRAPAFGLDAWVRADAPDCFAVALSHPAEGPGSISLSLFGRDLPAGRTAVAEAALSIGPMEK